MANPQIFKITVLGWEKHNGNKKKGHRYFLLENRFFEDSKISNLSASETILYIKLLATAGDLNSNCFETHSKLLPNCMSCGDKLLAKYLETLQSFQLISYEILEPLYNIIEKKRIEKNRKEVPTRSTSKKEMVEKPNQELNKKIWESYKNAFLKRYRVEPVRNASVNSQISNLGKRLGEDAPAIIAFYVFHNDSFFIKNTHSIGIALKQAESLATQWATGKPITSTMIRSFEKNNGMNEVLERIERDGI
jgi:hypothetical protein